MVSPLLDSPLEMALLSGITKSRHSRRRVPPNLSQMAFAFGARTGVRRTVTPNSFTDLSNCWETMLSRSWIKYRYPWPPGSASRYCCRVHSAVGCAVTLLWIIRRVAISRITNTYRVRKVAVTTVKKSQATITWAWFRTKVSHRGWGSGVRTGLPTCRYFSTVRGETRIPSFSFNSLAMRSSPQVTFSAANCRINCRRFFGKPGLPVGFDFQRQNSRNPLRCQRMSVSAWTFTSAPRQGNMRLSVAITQRVESLARRGLTLRSWKSASCLRRKPNDRQLVTPADENGSDGWLSIKGGLGRAAGTSMALSPEKETGQADVKNPRMEQYPPTRKARCQGVWPRLEPRLGLPPTATSPTES